jgi:predicted transcriptional regulator
MNQEILKTANDLSEKIEKLKTNLGELRKLKEAIGQTTSPIRYTCDIPKYRIVVSVSSGKFGPIIRESVLAIIGEFEQELSETENQFSKL